MKKHLIYILSGIAMLLIIILLIVINDFKIIRIDGHSMNPTLYESNYVISSNYKELERGDIIMFYQGDQKFIKRILGLPGDTVEMTQDCKIYINGERVKENYIECYPYAFNNEQQYPLTVPEGEYFILGDNRNDSLDSRVMSIGTIEENRIIGEINLVIFPFKTLK